MKERSHCPTSWSASGVVSVLGLGHSNRYVVVFHCFIFANNDLWHWASSHMRLCHLYIFFVEVIMPCYFLHFWWLHIGGLADSGVPAPPQTRQFLETVNDLSACLSCENHQPGRSPHPHNLLYGALTPRATFCMFQSSQGQTADSWNSPWTPKPAGIIQTSQ